MEERVFLSYSSRDRQLVESVKKQISRVWTIIDEDCFEAGMDFREAINANILKTTLFVFFASQNSLASNWVQFELEEAFWLASKERGFIVMTIILDKTDFTQLPVWMTKSKIELFSTSKLVAQIIKGKLLEHCKIDLGIFMGRNKDVSDFNEDVNNCEKFPNIIAFTGLDGIGRRTFALHALRDRFNLPYQAQFNLYEGDRLVDLYRKLVDQNMESLSTIEIIETQNFFVSLKLSEQYSELSRMIMNFNEKRVAPVLVDNNALLDENGFYKREFMDFFSYFSESQPDCYLVIIHNRLPQVRGSNGKLIYRRKIQSLSSQDCLTLFSSLIKKNNLPIIDFSQVKEISRFLDGYPPAIIYAVNECKLLGVDVVCNDKKGLLDYQSSLFTGYLSKLSLSPIDSQILEILYNVGGLTVKVISSISGQSDQDISTSLKKCIGFNIVEEYRDGLYVIAAPISVAVSRVSKVYSLDDFAKIAKIMIDNFWDENAIPSLAIVDVMISVILKSNVDEYLKTFKELIFPSSLYRAATQANAVFEWEMAEKYCRMALAISPNLNDAKNLLFKVLVRQDEDNTNHINEENELIKQLEDSSDKRIYYLQGFRSGKQHKFEIAISFYKQAKLAGDDSIQLHRDLAECYFQIGRISDAKKEIDIVIKKPGRKINDAYLLDLAAKISISLPDFEAAELYLERQELVDLPENYNHRKATYFLKKNDLKSALYHSDLACCNRENRIQSQFFFTRMSVCIGLKMFKEVENDYTFLKGKVNGNNREVLETIYTTMIFQRDGWKYAEAAFQKIRNKRGPYALYIWDKILYDKMRDLTISPIMREQAKNEKETIDLHRALDPLSKV